MATAAGSSTVPPPGSPVPAPSEKRRRLPQHMPWIFLAIALVATLAGWKLRESAMREQAHVRFEAMVQQVVGEITTRLRTYEQALRGGVGLFAANGSVSRRQWHDYTEQLLISQNFPGIQGIGFSLLIPPDRLEAHIAEMRAEGFPNYTVRPEGVRDLYSSIIYLEPFQDRNLRAFGYDMLSEPVRRAAMLAARDSGATALSGRVTLVQETNIDIQAGFLMYLPVYKTNTGPAEPGQSPAAGRPATHTGWVYAPFRSRDFMQGILGSNAGLIHLELFDGAEAKPDALLFSSHPLRASKPLMQDILFTNRHITLYGRSWLVQIRALDPFHGMTDHQQPILVLIFGCAISVLVFFLARSISQTEQRAVEIAARMTVALADKQADLERTNREMERFTEVLAHHLQEPVRHQYAFAQRLDRLLPKPLPGDIQKSLDYILKGAVRLRLLLRDVQFYLSLGRSSHAFSPCAASTACAAARADLADKIAACDAEILCDSLPTVWIDAAHLRDVFHALLDNALEYRHPERRLRVQVRGAVTDGIATLSVADNGSGIPPQYRARVFQVFERFHPSNSHDGTGIGLSIAQKIVEAAHGHIWIESGSGDGIMVCFTLPAATTGTDPNVSKPNTPSANTPGPSAPEFDTQTA